MTEQHYQNLLQFPGQRIVVFLSLVTDPVLHFSTLTFIIVVISFWSQLNPVTIKCKLGTFVLEFFFFYCIMAAVKENQICWWMVVKSQLVC